MCKEIFVLFFSWDLRERERERVGTAVPYNSLLLSFLQLGSFHFICINWTKQENYLFFLQPLSLYKINPIPPSFSQYPHLIIFRPLTYSLFVCHTLTHSTYSPKVLRLILQPPKAPNWSKDLVNKTNKLYLVTISFLLLLLQSVTSQFVTPLNSDGIHLLKFKYSILSDPLSVLKNWNYDDVTPCSWHGVACMQWNWSPWYPWLFQSN